MGSEGMGGWGSLRQGQLKGKLQVGGKYLVHSIYTDFGTPPFSIFGAICYCAVSVKPISCDCKYVHIYTYISPRNLHGDTDSCS